MKKARVGLTCEKIKEMRDNFKCRKMRQRILMGAFNEFKRKILGKYLDDNSKAF